jgi:predicted enzyme related to lactoylglutathione lyase
MMPQRLIRMHLLQSAFSLPVTEPKRTFEFYRSVFGAEICELDENTVSLQLPGVTVFFTEREEFNVLLKPADAEANFATGSYTSMLSATVATRDELYGSLKSAQEAGGTPCGQATSYPWGMAAAQGDKNLCRPDTHTRRIGRELPQRHYPADYFPCA